MVASNVSWLQAVPATAQVSWLRVAGIDKRVAGAWSPCRMTATLLGALSDRVLDAGLACESGTATALPGTQTETLSFVGTVRRGGATYSVDVTALVTRIDDGHR